MAIAYDRQTVNSPNPLARYAHRSRLAKSLQLATAKRWYGKVLDYGCGSGAFIEQMNRITPGCAIGYEPFMTERSASDLPIFTDLSKLKAEDHKFGLITLFETIEHLTDSEIASFLEDCIELLSQDGGIIVSGPIEIGPALILKEMNRSVLRFHRSSYGLMEFLKASLLGIAGNRPENIKITHKGFDFREAIVFVRNRAWTVEVIEYGPLPFNTWYGNSQFYLWITKD